MRDGRLLAVSESFSLRETCGPVAWGRGRWPNVDWIDGHLIWCGLEQGATAVRIVTQTAPGSLSIEGTRDPDRDRDWARRVLAIDRTPPAVADPVVLAIAARFPGLRPMSAGSLFDGIVTSIAGQSISVASAAVTERRLAALFHEGVDIFDRRFWPMPAARDLANAEPSILRTSGVTWKRAEAIRAAAIAQIDGNLPSEVDAFRDAESATSRLRSLPLVGEWTARSALLWGVGADDAFPPNDAALLRAARQAYDAPELDHSGLNRLASGWAPGRSWAARWLWTALLGLPPSGA